MTLFTRRDALQLGAGALAGTTMLASGSLRAQIAVKDVAPPKFEIEDGATPARAAPVQVRRRATRRCSSRTARSSPTRPASQVTVDQRELGGPAARRRRPRPRSAAAPTSSAPGPTTRTSSQAQCVDLTDLATYLGEKYGGWWPIVEKYGKSQTTGNWIAMPIGASGNRVVYRKSWVNEAGYETIPTDLDGFLDMASKLKANGHPIGFALGNADRRRQRLVPLADVDPSAAR